MSQALVRQDARTAELPGRQYRGVPLRGSLLQGAIAIVVCLITNSASAAIVPLVPGSLPQGFPDVTVSVIGVSYDADTDQFHAGITPGGILTIDQDGALPTPDHIIFNSTFDVPLTIDGTGVALVGSLSLSGNYDSPAGPVVSLNSSTLAGFGYDPLTGVFSFHFDDTISTIPGFGSLVEINLGGNFPGTIPAGFGSDFTNAGQAPGLGAADVFAPVPVPSSMIVWSMCSALAGLTGWRRWQRRLEAA